LDLSAFKGTWLNTNQGPKDIEKIVLNLNGSKLHVHIFGSLHPGPRDWGEEVAESIYADPADPKKGMAFLARFELPSMGVDVGVNLNQGLLVMAMFNTFVAQGSSNYFAREFFRQ
jgi:hypothetical protein